MRLDLRAIASVRETVEPNGERWTATYYRCPICDERFVADTDIDFLVYTVVNCDNVTHGVFSSEARAQIAARRLEDEYGGDYNVHEYELDNMEI